MRAQSLRSALPPRPPAPPLRAALSRRSRAADCKRCACLSCFRPGARCNRRRHEASACQSRASGLAMTLSSIAESRTVAAHRPEMRHRAEGRQRIGRHAAETRLDAVTRRRNLPECGSSRRHRCPAPAARSRAASAADEPPEEPPGVFALFQGLRVTPVRGESVEPFQPNSGVVVLPIRTAPASRSRATHGASSVHGPLGSMVREPRSVGQPLVSSKSLIATGTPSSGDNGSPACQRASDSSASLRAESRSTRQNALISASSASMRPRQDSVTSTGERPRSWNACESSAAESSWGSLDSYPLHQKRYVIPGRAKRGEGNPGREASELVDHLGPLPRGARSRATPGMTFLLLLLFVSSVHLCRRRLVTFLIKRGFPSSTAESSAAVIS